MFEVSVCGWFSAEHRLRLADGSFEPLHGHDWRVTVTYAGPRLDDGGLLVDFTLVRPRLQAVLAKLHDKLLNELPAFATRNPSAENVAVYIAEELGSQTPPAAGTSAASRAGVRLICVEVEEEPGCVARYRPNSE